MGLAAPFFRMLLLYRPARRRAVVERPHEQGRERQRGQAEGGGMEARRPASMDAAVRVLVASTMSGL